MGITMVELLATIIVLALGFLAVAWVYHWPIWWRTRSRVIKPGPLGPTPMQKLFTNEETGMLLKYNIQWTSVEQGKRTTAELQKKEADSHNVGQ
jgi:hypothetical protein